MDGRIELQNLIRDYRAKHPEYKGKSDAEIISVLLKEGLPNLTPEQQISIYEHGGEFGCEFLKLEHSDSIVGKRDVISANGRKNPFDPNNMTKEEKQFVSMYRKTHPHTNHFTDTHILAIMKLRPYNIYATDSYYDEIELNDYESGIPWWNITLEFDEKENKASTVDPYSLGGRLEIDESGRFIFTTDGISVWNDKTKEWEWKDYGKEVIRYFSADGTEITKDYYNEVKNGAVYKTKDDKLIYMKQALEQRHQTARLKYQQTKDSQGIVGIAWNGIKILAHCFGLDNAASWNIEEKIQDEKAHDFGGYYNSRNLSDKFLYSRTEKDKAEAFTRLTGEEYSEENVEKLLRGEIKLSSEKAAEEFEESQNNAVDMFGDIVSGVAALGIYTFAAAAAPFTAGASIALGVGAATLAGGLIKTGIKYGESLIGGKEYKKEDVLRDLAMGGFSGLISPITGGLGGAVGKGVAKAFGIQALKHTGKLGAEKVVSQGLKGTLQKALLNPTGYEYVGGTVATSAAFGAEVVTDGALSGGIDTAFRTKYDGGSWEESLEAGVEGFQYGAILSPIMGFGFKAVGKAGQEIGAKSRGKKHFAKYSSEKYIQLSNAKLEHLEGEIPPEARELFELIKNNDKIKSVKEISENLDEILVSNNKCKQDVLEYGRYSESGIYNDDINSKYLSFRLNLLKKYMNDERFGVDENFTNMIGHFTNFKVFCQNDDFPTHLYKVLDDILSDSKYATKEAGKLLDSICYLANSEQSAKDLVDIIKHATDTQEIKRTEYRDFVVGLYRSCEREGATDDITAKNMKAILTNSLTHKNFNNIDLVTSVKWLFNDDLNKMLDGWIGSLPLNKDLSEIISNPSNVDQIKKLYNISPALCAYSVGMYDFWGKELSQLTKKEKKEYIAALMNNKSYLVNYQGASTSKKLKELDIKIPFSSEDYVTAMKNLSNSLNISYTSLSPAKIARFNETLDRLMQSFKTIDLSNVGEIKLKISHEEFMSRVNKLLKDLSPAEQAKVCDFYGFQIVDGKLSGYPSSLGKEFESAGITDTNALSVLKKLKSVVDDYTDNNFMFVENNPALNKQLKELSEVLPEMFNQIDGGKTPIETLKAIQRVVKNSGFDGLSESDKKVMMIATLLHNTDKASLDTAESAFDAFFIAKKFNLSDKDAQKVYSIIQSSDVVDKFMSTSKRRTGFSDRGINVRGQEREDVFDLLAYRLKEENNFDLAQMLYSSKYTEGFTRHFDRVMKARIKEIKSTDFVLPQTTKETILQYSPGHTTIKRITFKKGYNVKVVHAKDIPDFYSFAHTPDANFTARGDRSTNFANFWAFSTLNDDKIICTSYIGNGKYGLAAPNGFLFNVGNTNQHVAFGHDIFSHSRNVQQMVVEYLRDKGLMARRHRGEKFGHRTMVSNVLKSILYGKDYYKMTKELDNFVKNLDTKYDDLIRQAQKELKGKELIYELNKINKQKLAEIEKISIAKEMNEMDEKYIARIDNIKTKLGDTPMTMENLRKIDPEFAKAYEQFLNLDGSDKVEDLASLLRSYWHNEVLVSNPEISAIYTKNIKTLPEEYFIKAEQENIPIVILD